MLVLTIVAAGWDTLTSSGQGAVAMLFHAKICLLQTDAFKTCSFKKVTGYPCGGRRLSLHPLLDAAGR